MDRESIRSTAALYNAVADEYATRVGTELNSLAETDFDIATLAGVAESLARRNGVVLDLGCGPGRVAAYLQRRGINAVGIDLSVGMLANARATHPSTVVACGSLTDIPVRPESVIGAVCWYSIIHTPPADLDVVCGEIRRVCRADADVLIAFQAGNGERIDRADAYASGLPMTNYRHSVDRVAGALDDAGIRVIACAVREPELEHESSPQAFVVATT